MYAAAVGHAQVSGENKSMARIHGVWRSFKAGQKMELVVGSLSLTDSFGNVWVRRGIMPPGPRLEEELDTEGEAGSGQGGGDNGGGGGRKTQSLGECLSWCSPFCC